MKRPKTSVRSATEADKVFGDKIRARRVEIGMSQETLAQSLGLTFQQVQKYEKGVNRVSAVRLGQIAKALEISTDYFLHVTSKHESDMLKLVTDNASQRLLRAFHKIPDQATRYKVVGLLEAITHEAA